MTVLMPQLRAGLSLVALLSLVACDIPTGAPIYDTLWEVPGKNTSISVNTLLPSGVTLSPDNSAFQVTVSPSSVSINRSLGQDCTLCNALNGQSAPKPAFVGGGSASVAIPSSVTSATLVRDTLTVTLSNGFNFDPLRPSASARGYMVINVKNGVATIGRDSIDGNSTAFPASANLVRKIPLSGTITGANGIQISTSLNSPAGDVIFIDMTRAIGVTGSLGTFSVSAAQVAVANQAVTSGASDLDLKSVDSTITKRVGGGSLLLSVNNPFNVTGNLTVSFAGATIPIQKTVTLSGGASSPTISFTKSEIAAMFGRMISMKLSGNVNGASVTVAPGQVVSVASRLQVALTVGGK
jgi:hypothetical protein